MGFAALCVCSLSRLWVGREISWSHSHNVSPVNICVLDINGVDRNDGIYVMLKEHRHYCKWCYSPYSHDSSFVVRIASGSTLVCGPGNALRIQAYGSGSGHGLIFGDSLRFRTFLLGR